MRWRVLSAGIVVFFSSALAGQQARPPAGPTDPQAPTFKVQAEYVEVDVQVTDQKATFIGGLKKEDFEVLEDGKPQTIATFSLVDIPVERSGQPVSAQSSIEPDVRANERRFDGRVYVVMLDDLHIDFTRTILVKNAMRRFIEQHLGSNDLMAITLTGGQTNAAREFTSNKRALLTAIDTFMGQQCRSFEKDSGCPIRSLDVFDPVAAGPAIPPRVVDERRYDARRTMSLLKQTADWFNGVRGRKKTLILVSEGIDYDPRDSAGIPDIDDAIASAARSNVSIYAFDPRGLSLITEDTMPAESRATTLSIEETQAAAARPPGSPSPGTSLDTLVKAFTTDVMRAQTTLRALADGTGGFAAIGTNNVKGAFNRIVAENSRYYVLAYYPPAHPSDGKFHRIEVRVKRPGVTIRSRRGYASPKGNAPAPAQVSTERQTSLALNEALNSPIQVSDIRMRVYAAPFRAASSASVVFGIELVGRDLTLESNSPLEIAYDAVDRAGKSHGARSDRMMLNVEPNRRASVQQTGLRVLNRMDLSPGQYQLRIAAHDPTRRVSGSVVYDLEVPDFDHLPLSMSGLLLISKSGSAMLAARVDEQIRSMLPAPPDAVRTFPQSDELAVFAEVYDDPGAPTHSIDINTAVRSDTGVVVFERAETHASSVQQKGTYRHTMRIPVRNLGPGEYVLSVEAKSDLNGAQAVVRRVPFTVTPPEQPH